MRRPIVRVLLWATAVLAVLHLLGVASADLWRTETVTGRSIVGSWLSLDSEAGFGTWFAVVQAALAAAIAALIALREHHHGRSWWGWALVAGVLAALSLDEQIMFHENLGRIGAAFSLTIAGVSPWFVPAAVLVVIVGAALLPFAVSLPRRTRRRLVAATAIFLLGALGFEVLAWVYVVLIADDPAAALSPVVGVLQLIEETLEMLAVTLAIATLLDHGRRTAT